MSRVVDKFAPATAPTVPGLGTRMEVRMQTQVSRRRSLRASDLDMECIALNGFERRLWFNPTPEIDSLAEELVALESYGVPRHKVRHLLSTYVKPALRANKKQHDVLRERMGEIRGETQGLPTIQSFTVRGVVDALREPLGVLADARRGKPVTQRDLNQAQAIVADAVRVTPRDVLLARSMPHQLRAQRYAELVAAVEAAA